MVENNHDITKVDVVGVGEWDESNIPTDAKVAVGIHGFVIF